MWFTQDYNGVRIWIPSRSLGFQRNHEKTEERGLLHNVKTSFFCVYVLPCFFASGAPNWRLNITYLKGNDAPRLDELLPVCLSLCGAFCSYTQITYLWRKQIGLCMVGICNITVSYLFHASFLALASIWLERRFVLSWKSFE